MDDETFLREFEACRIAGGEFRHADHVRLAWIYLRRHEYAQAEARMRNAIRTFAARNNAAGKNHETVTVGWMRLVAVAHALSGRVGTFADFIRVHPWLLEKDALLEFYSKERLGSDEARAAIVPPDRKPLPVLQV